AGRGLPPRVAGGAGRGRRRARAARPAGRVAHRRDRKRGARARPGRATRDRLEREPRREAAGDLAPHPPLPDGEGPAASRCARPAAPGPGATPAPAPPPGPAPPPRVVVRGEPRYVTLLRAVLAPPADVAAVADAALADSVTDASRALAVLVEKVQSFGGRLAA